MTFMLFLLARSSTGNPLIKVNSAFMGVDLMDPIIGTAFSTMVAFAGISSDKNCI